MFWFMTKIGEDGIRHQTDVFFQMNARYLEESTLRNPESEAIISRLSLEGLEVNDDEIDELLRVFEQIWDRSQRGLTESIINAGGLPMDSSLKSRQIARELRHKLKSDAYMVCLDGLLNFLNRVRKESGSFMVTGE